MVEQKGDPADEHADASWNRAARGETEEQRLDRNFDELLQELRVAQTGVQILFAFLLTLPFSQRFEATTPQQRWLYLFVLVCTAGATGLLIGPVSFHRLVFRQHRKSELVHAGDRMATGGLAFLLLAIVGSVLLVADVVLSGRTPFVVAGGVALWILVFWYVIPLRFRQAGSPSRSDESPATRPNAGSGSSTER